MAPFPAFRHSLKGKEGSALALRPYDRQAAVLYAHEWAYGRNPKFYDYERIGGGPTKFSSHCPPARRGTIGFSPPLWWGYNQPDRHGPGPGGGSGLPHALTPERPSAGRGG